MNRSAPSKMLRHVWQRFFMPHPEATPVDMTGKQIVVTGCAPGSIGYLTAKTLVAWGADVVITTRSGTEQVVTRLQQELANLDRCGKLVGYALDLSIAESVLEFTELYRRYQGEHLDVLINNAGIHLDLLAEWKQPRLTPDNFEIHWRTNYLGSAHLTHELLPLLLNAAEMSGDARVVNIVSHLHEKGHNSQFFAQTEAYNSWHAYGQSKLALIHHAMEIERRFAAKGLHGFAVHPGSIYTNIANRGLAGHPWLQGIRNRLGFLEKRLLLTPEQGVQTQLMCATEPGIATGNYFVRCDISEPSLDAQDFRVANTLWQETEQWITDVTTLAVNSKPAVASAAKKQSLQPVNIA
ncbi:MAG: SDR family NAD(P)-dependent oxidoreductase [Pseudomonadales bacterium]|nr:SDR family NAD(P)-dependent oxidoreductase [Pseudomonadales bacterium]